MLPTPFVKFIPKIFQKDTKAIAMADKIDTHLALWKRDILSIEQFRTADECPASVLNELGYLLNAGIQNEDSETVRRSKIYNAILNHKNRGTWDDDVKLRIQAITGIEPELFNQVDNDDWILLGKESTDPDRYWATLGTDAIDDELGIWLVGDMTEYVIAGNIYIDLKSSILTAAQIQQIVDDLSEDIAPAYYAIYLGYISAGIFVVYAGGIID